MTQSVRSDVQNSGREDGRRRVEGCRGKNNEELDLAIDRAVLPLPSSEERVMQCLDRQTQWELGLRHQLCRLCSNCPSTMQRAYDVPSNSLLLSSALGHRSNHRLAKEYRDSPVRL